jgi:hypothetical protein
MSAFAARQQLWGQSATTKVVVEKALEKAVEDGPRQTKSETRFTRILPSRSSKRRSTEEAVLATTPDAKQTQGIDSEKEGSKYVLTAVPL